MTVVSRAILGIGAFAALITAVACTDNLEAGAGCGVGLCPAQAITLQDTVIDLVGDTTALGFPPIGSETYNLLASRGDTLDTRLILRYDSLPTTYLKSNVDSTIVNLDSAFLELTTLPPDSAHKPVAPFTIEVYDVDTVGVDSVAAPILAQFRPDRLLGSRTFSPDSVTDSLRIPIRSDTLLAEITQTQQLTGKGRLRIGLRLLSSASEELRVQSTQVGQGSPLVVYASADTAARPVQVFPRSTTPANATFLAGALADYIIVAHGLTSVSPGVLSVGGIPGRRALLHVDIPKHIVDSSTIVRATLLLTQRPNHTVDAFDSMPVSPGAILVNAVISDPSTELRFLSTSGTLGLPTEQLVPADSGVKAFEVVNLIRTWRLLSDTVNRRLIGLHTDNEGSLPGEIDFFSTTAAEALRPKLRITYVQRPDFGLP